VVEPLAQVEALADGRLIVWSQKEARRLYASGFYGKPLGVPKPKDDFDAPLILDPIEGLYLVEEGYIEIVSGEERRSVSAEEFRKIADGILEGLDERYRVYRNLREKGYVVTPGIKYGCDFAVYEHGPGVDHAPFIVQVKTVGEGLSAREIVEAGRLATTVRKTFIVALIIEDEVRFLSFKWWKP
jgi:tRNA-intron endonuclease